MASVSPLRALDNTKAFWGYLFVFALGYTVAELQRSYAASKRPTEAEVSPVAVPPEVQEVQDSKTPEQERNDHSASQRIGSEPSPEVQEEAVETPLVLLDVPARNWADDEDWVHTIPVKSQEQVEENENPWDVDVHTSQVSPHSPPPWGSVSTETDGGWGNVPPSKAGEAREHIVPTQIKAKGKPRTPGRSSARPGPKRDGDLCPQCFRPFGTGFALQEHIRQFHPSGPPAQRGTNTAGATCEICHANLASASEVRRHASNEHPWSYLCTAHLKSFRDPYQALDHYREVHQAHDVTFDTIEAFLGNIKPQSTQNKSTEPILVQGPASAGAAPGDAIPDQSAVPQAPPDDARHSAAARVHGAALKRHTFTANSTENHSNVLDPGDSSTSGLTVQVPAEPATTPLMCMICRQVFKDHPRLAQHALYPCTRFLAPGQKTFFDPKPAVPNSDPVKVIADGAYDESAVFPVWQSEAAEATNQDRIDGIDASEPASHPETAEVADAPSSNSSEDLEGSDGQLLTPEESTDDDDVRVLSPDPTARSMYAESIQSQGTFLDGPMDGMTPDTLQRAEFTSSNRWNTGGPPVASRRNIPQHVRTHPDFVPAQRMGATTQVRYHPRQRWPEYAFDVDHVVIETQIPSFGLPARGTEFQPFGPPSSEQASSDTSPRSKAKSPKLGAPSKPASAWLVPLSVPSHGTLASYNHASSPAHGVSTFHTQDSQHTYRHPPGPIPPSQASSRTLKDIAQARPVAQISRRPRRKKPALQPVFDSGWQTLPVQQSTKSRGGKTQSYDPWGATSSAQPEADEGDYGGW